MVLYSVLKAISRLIDIAIGASRVYEGYIVKSNPLILESATGFGLNLALILDIAVKLGGRVYSIDISGYSVSLAKMMYRGLIEKGVLVVERGDLRRLHYRDSFFDYSINHTTMHHVGNVDAVITELWRTLKPGGVLVVIDVNPLPLGFGVHSPGYLREVKETVMRAVESRFKVLERGGGRLAYYIVAEKSS